MFNTADIDRLIEEDVPYFDLTSHVLGIGEVKAEIVFRSRGEIVICGIEECRAVFNRLGIETVRFIPSGTVVKGGEEIISGVGNGEVVHKAWKVCQNLLEYASGIATRTKRLVDLAKRVNPKAVVVTTRKTFPLAKKVCIKGILCGGALPHRLGLSETILIFKNHHKLWGGFENLVKKLDEIKQRVPEKKIVVEAENPDEARILIDSGVDVVQLDKFSVCDVKEVVKYRDWRAPHVKVAVAGGINEKNIEDYASTGAEIIVLTSAYFGKPADIGVEIRRC
jgi:molybdenum transport protein